MPPPALPPELAARRRRSRIVYAAVVVVAVLAVGLTMGIVIGTGESAHATLVTGTAAPVVPGGTIRPAPTRIWQTDDEAASGDPLWVGTVVTWSDHRLAGRDATTGAIRWSYTRTDFTICDAAQHNGRAFVLFGRDGDCDEISTFDAETGERGWFRTLPDVGPGRLLFGATGLVIAFPTSFHAMTDAGGIDRFPSVPTTGSDCRFTAVVPGVSGILASERCADGEHLALWSNDGEKSEPQRLWRVGVEPDVTAVAVSTNAAFGYDPVSGELSRFGLEDGATLGPATLDPTTTGPAGTTQDIGADLLLDLGDRAVVVAPDGSERWSAASTGSATVADDATTGVLVPTADGAEQVDAVSGDATATYTFAIAGPGDAERRRVYPAGAGLLVAGPGLAYLR